MPVFAVLYRYADDSDATRDEHRPVHRDFLNADHGSVEVLATGPWADGEPGALIVVGGPDLASVTAVLDQDPFRTVGVIADRSIREWSQVRSPWV